MDILRDLPSIAKSPSDKFAVVATAVAAKEDDYAADHTAVAAVRVNEHMTFAQLGVWSNNNNAEADENDNDDDEDHEDDAAVAVDNAVAALYVQDQ